MKKNILTIIFIGMVFGLILQPKEINTGFSRRNACSIFSQRKHQQKIKPEDIVSRVFLIAIVGAGVFGLLNLIAYFNYDEGENFFKILDENPGTDYESLKKTARKLYRNENKSISTDLYNDYPTMWLARNTSEKIDKLGNFLIFKKKYKELSKNLNDKLDLLTNNDEFLKEQKEFNDKKREYDYKQEKLSIEKEKLSIKRAKILKNTFVIKNQ